MTKEEAITRARELQIAYQGKIGTKEAQAFRDFIHKNWEHVRELEMCTYKLLTASNELLHKLVTLTTIDPASSFFIGIQLYHEYEELREKYPDATIEEILMLEKLES